MVLVGGASRLDTAERAAVLEYRAALAETAVLGNGPGSGPVRNAFTRMGTDGAAFIAMVDPVRFLQLSLIDAADWRQRSADQREVESTRLAREMLEFGSGGAWSAVGEVVPGGLRVNGGMSWESLARLSAAIGITESIGME